MKTNSSSLIVSSTTGHVTSIRVGNGHTAGRVKNFNSDTAANTKNPGRPEVRVSIPS